LMYDLQVLAWQAEIRRISTFLMCKELSGSTYPKSGIRDAFHILSHHSNVKDNIDRFAVLNAYHVRLFAYFLDKLRSTPDGDGSLLDHVILLYGGGISHSDRHTHGPLPTLVVGGGAGAIKGGRHLVYPEHTPLTNLQLTLLTNLGVPTEKLGDSTGKLQALSGLA